MPYGCSSFALGHAATFLPHCFLPLTPLSDGSEQQSRSNPGGSQSPPPALPALTPSSPRESRNPSSSHSASHLKVKSKVATY